MYLLRRIFSKIWRTYAQLVRIDHVTRLHIHHQKDTILIGTKEYSGWKIPKDILKSGAVCYCAGVGEDASFDLELATKFHCTVLSFDPTPRAIAYIEKLRTLPKTMQFFPFGIWDKDERIRFYEPGNPNHVSHSALNLHGTTKYFEADCHSISTLMKDFGHESIALLKLDIEGAEYRVIDSLIQHDIFPSVICVEYDEAYKPLDKDWAFRIKASLEKLISAGYRIIEVDRKCNYTLARV
jgi:FkbM family methyltransferase